MADEIEHVVLVIREALVYRLPPRQSNKGYRAADWGLEKPLWTGRLKITTKGKMANISLLDATNGQLFAEAPIDGDPAKVVESVIDSSRYYVVKVVNQGKHAFLGMGFQDRSEAFDFNVALQDYAKSLTKQKASTEPYVPKHDLKMEEGQTIKIKIKTKKKGGGEEDGFQAHGKSAAPMVSLGAAFGDMAVSGDAPNPFASGPSSAAAANPFASAPATAANPFASADPFAAKPAATDEFGSFESAPSSSATGGGDWVAF